ncbi:MAG: phosphonate ABC transporter ATP-binding protein [Alphaproteobacteria bacterium]|nr:phosphonate ABC transporter ATP-binding protein [Alphaproteobacteria bacterium]
MPTSSAIDRIRVIDGPNAVDLEREGAQSAPSLPRFTDAPGINSKTALAVKGLGKTYTTQNGTNTVLRDVSFAINAGDSVAIVGANGSGKSTSLRCAMRLIEPTTGEIFLEGRPLMGLSGLALRKARSKVGFVFQKHNLSTRLSVLSNVLHGGFARGCGIRNWTHSIAPKEERDRALDCLDQVGLADLAGRRADQLSGGQSQRVAIARALMQGPSLIFADEPAASLDPKAGEDMMALFSDLCRRTGLTLIVVSHNLEHALAYADRLIGLQAGSVVLDRKSTGLTREDLAWLYEETGA